MRLHICSAGDKYLAVRLEGFKNPDLCFAEIDCELALITEAGQCIHLSLESSWGNGHQNWPGARAHSKLLLPLMLGLQSGEHLPAAPMHADFLSPKVCEVVNIFVNITHMYVI